MIFKKKILIFSIAFVFLFFLGFFFLESKSSKIIKQDDGIYVKFSKAYKLNQLFNDNNYDLENIKKGKSKVPRIFVEQLPLDMAKVKDENLKKELFIKIMLPLVLNNNEKLINKRKEILDLLEKVDNDESLSLEQINKIEALAADYEVATTMIDEKKSQKIILEQLSLKIGEIPTSLAIAQAMLESNFGTSEYAIKYNAIFGILDWDGKGIVPKNRPKDETYTIRNYDTILDAVEDYAHLLNRDITFEPFRMRRRQMRRGRGILDGRYISAGVLEYLNRGMFYVTNIRNTMSKEKIRPLDRAKLDDIKQN